MEVKEKISRWRLILGQGQTVVNNDRFDIDAGAGFDGSGVGFYL